METPMPVGVIMIAGDTFQIPAIKPECGGQQMRN